MRKNDKKSELTVLSGIAILFVLGIHALAGAMKCYFPNAAGYEYTSFILCTFFNLVAPAVPIFLFVSGYKYYLHDTGTPYVKFLRKRLPRVLVSFAILNTFFWLIDAIVWRDQLNPRALVNSYISSWLGNSVAYQLWYIPMYCLVIAVCPLVYRLVRNSNMRLGIFLAIGLLYKILSMNIPLLQGKPFMFISYPLFFEMGVSAAEKNLRERAGSPIMISVYIVIVTVISCLFPTLSRNAVFQYLFVNILGTLACYRLSIVLANNKILYWLGTVSYPVFLLHDPVIGQFVSAQLAQFGGSAVWIYLPVWILIVLISTVCLMKILERLHMGRILWNFRLRNS